MHIKAPLFSVFTGTLLLGHMVLAGGLCSQFDSDILSLNVPPWRRTDSNGRDARRAQTFLMLILLRGNILR